jgi:hypothetical protein
MILVKWGFYILGAKHKCIFKKSARKYAMIISFTVIIVLSQQRPGFNLGLVCMGLAMSRIALKQGYL